MRLMTAMILMLSATLVADVFEESLHQGDMVKLDEVFHDSLGVRVGCINDPQADLDVVFVTYGRTFTDSPEDWACIGNTLWRVVTFANGTYWKPDYVSVYFAGDDPEEAGASGEDWMCYCTYEEVQDLFSHVEQRLGRSETPSQWVLTPDNAWVINWLKTGFCGEWM
jgi:hypothetical protein